jgi:2-iminobutanoate/2-iminopropanoate deaminase
MTRQMSHLRICFFLAAACIVFGAADADEMALAQGQQKTKLAPPNVFLAPTAPYSLGTIAQGKRIIFVSGQTAQDEKGAVVGKDDVAAQARQEFANMKAVLKAGGASMDDVVKITILLKNAADLPKIAGVRKEFFKEPYPASIAYVATLLNPDLLVEVDAIALID